MKKNKIFFKLLKVKILIFEFLIFQSFITFGLDKKGREQDSLMVIKIQTEATAAGKLGDFELALEKFTAVYKLREKLYGSESIKLTSPLNNIGITYKNLGNFEKSIEAYKKVESICIKTKESNNLMLGIVYTNLGNIYRLNGDYDKALEYQENACRLLKKDSVKFWKNFQACKLNIAEIKLKLGLSKETIRLSIAYLNYFSNDSKPNIYDLLAQAYFNLGDYQLSEKNYLNAIESWIKLYGEGNIELISEYLSYSLMLLSKKQFDKALNFIQKANNLVLKFYREKSTQNAEVLSNYGDYYFLRNSEAGQIDDFRRKRKENLDNAIQYYQKSIVALVDSFHTTDPFINPPLKNVISDIQLVDVVNKKALALERLAEIFRSEFDDKNAEKYYLASLNSFSLVVELIHRLQIGFENEDSRLFLSKNQQSTFFEAINVSYKLFTLTKERKYVLKAFEFSERSKSSNLLASIKDIRAKEFGGIPDSLLQKETVLKNYINTYNSKLFEENTSEKPDPQKVNLYSSRIFKYNEEYNRLIDSFEKNYPEYFSLKYENKVIGAEQVQKKLNNRQALIEYYLKEPENSTSNGELYLFAITNDSVNLMKESIDQEFVNKIQTLHDFLVNPNYLNTRKSDYVNYSLSAYGLCEKLLKPVAKKINGKSLTIIPHDKLSYIPFDALLSEMPDTTRMNFRDLKYVIRDYSINYGYSATLLYDSNSKRKSDKKLLIFSPDYNLREPRKDIETGISYYLSPLPGAKDEIKSISNYISSVSFVGKKAQESVFKKNANKFDILHLAMHTIVNDSLPMFSKLVFSRPDVTSSDDGYLNAYEVYNMKLNSRLAVLSACETGSGKLQGGEGVLSIARGFIYAGCPSVVMTLWQVEDKSGVQIMGDFYRFLSKGKRKDDALRMAKLNHLENSDPLTAHPHFWLGYVSIGNASALYTSNDVYFVIFLFVAFLLLLVDYHFRRKRS